MPEKTTKIFNSKAIAIYAALVFVIAMSIRVGIVVTLKLIFSFIAVFFLPGLALSIIVWPRKDEITLLVRLVTSIALSIVVVPLVIFWSYYLFHIAVSRTNVFVEIFSTTLVFLIIAMIYLSWLKVKHKNTPKVNQTEYLFDTK